MMYSHVCLAHEYSTVAQGLLYIAGTGNHGNDLQLSLGTLSIFDRVTRGDCRGCTLCLKTHGPLNRVCEVPELIDSPRT